MTFIALRERCGDDASHVQRLGGQDVIELIQGYIGQRTHCFSTLRVGASESQGWRRPLCQGSIAYVHAVTHDHHGHAVVDGIAWMVIVAAEMLSGNTGIGYFVWNSYNGGSLPNVMAAIVMIGLVGVVLDTVFMRIGRKVAA